MATVLKTPEEEIVVEDPHSLKTLYLGKKGISEVRDFEKFALMQVLWLNGNRLTSLRSIDHLTFLRELYLQDNRLNTLKGSLQSLKFLHTLLLHNNNLRDLSSTLNDIVHLNLLDTFSLHGNPCSQEEGYRKIVISKFPSLKVFDRHIVTEKDQKEQPTPQQSTTITPPLSYAEFYLEKDVGKVKKRIGEKNQLKISREDNESPSQSPKPTLRSEYSLPVPETLDFLKSNKQTPPSSPDKSSTTNSRTKKPAPFEYKGMKFGH
eukprot:TRINITY_DN1480_c0_g2_i1.p1 TRINITY_DN1480_c0_g2~~TRINITY_DN1480_c0_g2_i1.p1  ORF type:complete len:263 (-),score=60.10 TRINITY_DN1480_c0_g2_i1:70-858(-)